MKQITASKDNLKKTGDSISGNDSSDSGPDLSGSSSSGCSSDKTKV